MSRDTIQKLTHIIADAMYGSGFDPIARLSGRSGVCLGCDEDQYRALEIAAENLLSFYPNQAVALAGVEMPDPLYP